MTVGPPMPCGPNRLRVTMSSYRSIVPASVMTSPTLRRTGVRPDEITATDTDPHRDRAGGVAVDDQPVGLEPGAVGAHAGHQRMLTVSTESMMFSATVVISVHR